MASQRLSIQGFIQGSTPRWKMWVPRIYGWFPPSRIRCRIRSLAVSVKPCPCLPFICCWGVSAAGPGGRRSSFPRKRAGRAPGAYEWQARGVSEQSLTPHPTQYRSFLRRKNRIWSYMKGWTATANLRKRRKLLIFYVSYGVLTEFLRMNVILTYFATETAKATDTWRWKQGITPNPQLWRSLAMAGWYKIGQPQ